MLHTYFTSSTFQTIQHIWEWEIGTEVTSNTGGLQFESRSFAIFRTIVMYLILSNLIKSTIITKERPWIALLGNQTCWLWTGDFWCRMRPLCYRLVTRVSFYHDWLGVLSCWLAQDAFLLLPLIPWIEQGGSILLFHYSIICVMASPFKVKWDLMSLSAVSKM